MEWISSNWQWLAPLLLVVLVNVLNAVLRHYGDQSPGLARAIRTILDIVSGLTNADSPGTVKMPGTKSKLPTQTDAERRVLSTLLILPMCLLLVAGCATSWTAVAHKSIESTRATVKATWDVAGSALADACVKRARACAASQDAKVCGEFTECRKDLHRIGHMVITVLESAAVAHELVRMADEAKDEITKKHYMDAATKLAAEIAEKASQIAKIIADVTEAYK